MAGRIKVEIRWDGTTWTDETAHVMGATWQRGRGYASQIVARSGVGSADVTLRNTTGRYSYWEPTSPRYLQHLHGVGLRIRLVDPVEVAIWTGEIDDPGNNSQVHTAPLISLTAFGTFTRLSAPNMCAPVASPGDTYDVLTEAVLDAAAWPDAERVIAADANSSGIWSPGTVEPMAELREIESSALAFIYEGRNGYFHYEPRSYRTTETRCTTSQLTLSDDLEADYHYTLLNLSAPAQNVYDRINVSFIPVYTLEDDPVPVAEFVGSRYGLVVPAGQTRTFTIEVFGETAPYFMAEWVLPTLQAGPTTSTIELTTGGGYADPSDVTLSGIATTQTHLTFTLANGDPANPAVVLFVQIWGRRGYTGPEVHQIVGTGRREYPLPGHYYPDAGAASKAARWLYNYFNQPRHLVTVEVNASASDDLVTDVFARDLSDRITLIGTGRYVKLGMTQDFFIEAERGSCGAHGRDLKVNWQCSACLPNTHETEDDDASLPTGAGLYYAMEQSSGIVLDSLSTLYHLTRHGTTATVGIVGRGQLFVASQADALLNADSGLPDTALLNSWEWDGWVVPDDPSGLDEIILQKDIGAAPAYRLFEYALDPTHRYFMASVTTEDGTFSTLSTGELVLPDTPYFLRLVHDAVAKTLGWSVNLGPLNLVTYTGTPVSTSDGIVFGGSGDFSIESQLDYWYRALDLDGSLADGDPVTDWPDVSGNGRDTTGSAGTITFETAEAPDGGSVVRFNTGRFGIPEIALADTQIWVYAKVTATGFQGTLFRTSSTVGPNYALGINNAGGGNYYLWAHFYTDNNNGGVKRRVTTPITLPYGYHSIRVTDDGTGGTLAIAVDGAVQTIEPDTQSITGASGINPDETTQSDIKEIIVAHDLDSGQIADVEAYLPVGGSLAGSGTNSLGGVLDEWLYMPERVLTDAEAAARYNGGAGSTATGGSISSTNPTTPTVTPGSVPSGSLADRPLVAPPDSLYFATDEDGGTLYLMIGTTWTQVANGLTEAILKSIVDAKGDLIAGTAADTVARLAVGADGEFLRAASGEATGLEYYDHEGASDPHPQYTTAAEVAAAIGAIPGAGQYRALVLTSPDGIGVEIVDDGAGHAVTVLADLE